ncbi:MAG TPA: hypothetical protein VGJ55_10600 [Pyrinomonadaceae bacterium]|jgi:hypothetical protein
MTRNQKIAVGCGIALVIGLFLAILVGVFAYFVWRRQNPMVVYNSNSNSNYNANYNRNLNSRSTNSDSSSLSEDEKHRLFQAAGATKDNELINRALRKMGFVKSDGSVSADYQRFLGEHIRWGMKNLSFVNSVNTPEKARAYVEAHLND